MKLAVDGHQLDYEVRGEGRPLVMLHGLAVDRRVLVEICEPVLAPLQTRDGWRRIYVDLPGHGLSTGSPERMGADALVETLAIGCHAVDRGGPQAGDNALVEMLAAFVREVAGGPACLVGYSYGGYLAQGLLRELEGVGGLFLICPTVEADFGKRTVPARRIATRDPVLTFSEDPRERAAFEEVAVVQTQPQLESFQRIVHPANIGADQELMAATRARYAMSRPYMQALQAFEQPVSIVCGRDDHWVGFEDAMWLTRAFRRAHFSVLPDCGHLLPFEQPARFRALLLDWVGRLRGEVR